MLDVSTPSTTTRHGVRATALVTRAGAADLEVRVWPPEQVWRVGRDLADAGHHWEAALPDESGLPSSLVLRRGAGYSDGDLAEVVAVLQHPGLAALGYLAADERGASRRVPGPRPEDRDRVVFVELRQLPYADRWQVHAFGVPAALARLRTAAADIALGAAARHGDEHSTVLELPGRATAVQELVERLDRAGLDGHVRVLRHHQP